VKRSAALSVCVLAKMIYPAHVREQQQDMLTYARMRPWADRVYLVVSSAGARRHVSHHGTVVGLHIPLGANGALALCRFWLWGFLITRALVRRRPIDLLMAAEPLVGGPLGVLLRALTGIPLMVHIQGDLFHLPESLFSRLRIAVTRWITVQVARRADRVRCVSRAIHAACLRAGLSPDRVVLLPVRCDFEWFDRARWISTRETDRRRLGIASDDQVIASVGSLTVHKGYGVLIEALALVRARCPRARLVLAGAGPLRDELAALAARLGLTEVTHLAGPVAYAEVPRILAAADVYAQPSFDEGIPRATLEAMAMELPVVASRVGGLPELVTDGETGALVEPGDPRALAAALERALLDPASAADMGRRARRSLRDLYSMERAIERYGELMLETARRPAVAS
jgi:glycosyltransferase involved in cell wall biosynthesis